MRNITLAVVAIIWCTEIIAQVEIKGVPMDLPAEEFLEEILDEGFELDYSSIGLFPYDGEILGQAASMQISADSIGNVEGVLFLVKPRIQGEYGINKTYTQLKESITDEYTSFFGSGPKLRLESDTSIGLFGAEDKVTEKAIWEFSTGEKIELYKAFMLMDVVLIKFHNKL